MPEAVETLPVQRPGLRRRCDHHLPRCAPMRRIGSQLLGVAELPPVICPPYWGPTPEARSDHLPVTSVPRDHHRQQVESALSQF